MRGFNVATDIYSILIYGLMIIFFVSGGRRRLRQNRYLAIICSAGIVMSFGDMTNWLCESTRFWWNKPAIHIGSFVYWLSPVFMLYGYMAYVVDYLSERITVHPAYMRLMRFLCLLYTVGCLATPFTGLFYYIDAQNVYHRGEGFWPGQMFFFCGYAVAVVVLAHYRKYLKNWEIAAFLSYVLFPLLANLVQAFFYGIALVGMGSTLAVLCIFTNVQIQREKRLQEQKAELADARIAVMTSQINPHFLFNSLTVIRQLCQDDPGLARQTITEFSQYLRMNMETLTNRGMIPFEKELGHTKHYLHMEKLRFGDRLSVEYEITATEFFLPPLTLQPIVENAVRHGIMHREEGGRVTIRTLEEEKSYRIIVQDNGVGFHIDTVENGSHVGIANVRQRLAALCGGTVEITSVPGEGTDVEIVIRKEG